MNHSVFKDLVPSYIENLTSDETNKQMEEHMEQCAECREYFKEMQEDLIVEHTHEQKDEKRNIDYLKKVRSKNRRKIFMITGSLLALFLLLSIGYYFLFVHMWIADENNVETTIQQQNQTTTLTFQSKNDNRYLLAMLQPGDKEYIDTIIIYENWNILADTKLNYFSEVASNHQNGSEITYTFLDENTLLLPDGTEKKLTEEDIIHIQYKDRTKEIQLKDLYNAENNN
ncbi:MULTISPECIES: zf-HC2 domain-containing protein [Oceanobacillus]|uniref:Zf-HC2 domain-containing protein n=1 Tax=Oceanobacillus aidingensis TaxID=645964 RepID=A0ABV9JXS0_9BACI|nr:zf-HC2 domain-containing protein [Oceanobacillus oncorhynchi]MDM8100687.1 zf-HC2 domain-containing protein [Oceanobacillus oncorhynchi]